MKTLVLCYGNEFIKEDALAKEIADEVKLPNVEFKKCDSVEDIFNYKDFENIYILDVVKNAKEVMLIDNIDKLNAPELFSLHDFDLAFFLKLMKSIGKIKKINIIGIPMKGDKKRIISEIQKLIPK